MDKEPIYGAYIRGRNWFFMALEGNNFAISEQFNATKNEIFDIFRILNRLNARKVVYSNL